MQELDNTSIVTKFQHTQFLFCLMLLDVLFEIKLFAKLRLFFANKFPRTFGERVVVKLNNVTVDTFLVYKL